MKDIMKKNTWYNIEYTLKKGARYNVKSKIRLSEDIDSWDFLKDRLPAGTEIDEIIITPCEQLKKS